MQTLKNVQITNKSGLDVLNNVTMEVKSGDFLVVLGDEFSREVLLSTIGALEVVTNGEIYIDGIELSKYTSAQVTGLRRTQFGYFMKDSALEELLTVKENVELPLLFAGIEPQKREELVTRALTILGLINLEKFAICRLSEWQKNKVMLARAIVNNPKVLVLSEPVRVQNETRIKEVCDLLVELNKEGVTIVLASALECYQKIAKRRIEVVNGGVVELGKFVANEPVKKPRTRKTIKKDAETEKKPRKKKVKEEKVEG